MAKKKNKSAAAAAAPAAEEVKPEEQPAEEKKRKAEDPPAEEPEAKQQDTEQEEDAVDDKRPGLKSSIGFSTPDTTLNVVPTLGGKVLMSMNEGAMQYLIGGARANVGMKAGRYMYEVKIIEAFNPTEVSQMGQARLQIPRQTVRIGFSVPGSPLILGDFEDCIYFDSDGLLGVGKKRQKLAGLQKFGRDLTLAVVLNLDSGSDNDNTISLFREGVRLTKPFKLPENLVGKTLIPHIAFRSVSVYVNFGPTPSKSLPFKCRMLQSAAEKDTEAVAAKAPKDGKYEVLLPIAFPDEGTFEWLDEFLEKNPDYVELSDRKLKDWAASSGLAGGKGWQGGSNDKPAFKYGMPSMDNYSLQKIVSAVAPLSARNYVIMEVKSNLNKDERAKTLKRFHPHTFKRVARVVMGEPKEAFKKKVLATILKKKQEKVTAEWTAKKHKQKQQKIMLEKKKEAEERRKKAVEEAAKKKAEAEAKKKAEAEAKKKDDEKKDESEKKDEEMNDAEKKEEEKKEEPKEEKKEEPKEEKKEDEPMEDLGDEPPVAELTEEEKKINFLPKFGAGDLTQQVLNSAFADFSLPDKEESFDEIKYEWQPEAKAREYLRTWVLEKKATSRIDNLTPSQYFKDKLAAWTKQKLEWQTKQQTFKAGGKKKKDNKEQAGMDIFAVENINDTGGGEPLFASFEPLDWALLELRYELYLLLDAFKHDVNDPDRENIPEAHLPFYYGKYYSKSLNPKMFTMDTVPALVKLVKETVVIDEEKKLLKSQLSDVDSLDIFVKLGEESRRDRQRRIDAGDETARLKYVPPAAPAPAKPAAAKPAAQPAAAKPAAAKPAAAKPAAQPAAAKAAAAKPAAAKPAAAKPSAAPPVFASPVGALAQATAAAKPAGAPAWNNAKGSNCKGSAGNSQGWKGDGGQKGSAGNSQGWKGDGGQNWKGGGGGKLQKGGDSKGNNGWGKGGGGGGAAQGWAGSSGKGGKSWW